MAVTDTYQDAWTLGFHSLREEFAEEVELETEGTVPADLAGRLFRLSTAGFDAHGERYRHWFDADGMIHSFRIQGGRVLYRNRFVETAKKREQDRARRRLYASIGDGPAGGPLERLKRAVPPRSPANTNVVYHGGRLLAMWEGARPYKIDPITLETIGEESFDGVLGRLDAFSAHPHYQPDTEEMWNFGVSHGPRRALSIYRGRPDGTLVREHRIVLPYGAWIHDFAISRDKVAVIIPPLTTPRWELDVVTGRAGYADSLQWRPELGTRIAVFDKSTWETRWYHTEPFMVVHTINAFDANGDLVLDTCTFEDASIMNTIREAMFGRLQTQATPPFADRLILRADGRVDRVRLSELPMEFPRLAGRALTREPTRIYGCTFAGGAFDNIPAALDVATGAMSAAPLRPGEIGIEPIPVSKAGAADESDVWLLVIVLCAESQRSELRIYDGADPAAGAVATARIPHIVPLHFHGSWVPESHVRSAA